MYIVRQEVLCYLAELDCRAGRWERAVRIADESMDIVQETGQATTQSHVALFNQAWPRALLGRVDEAREQATTGVRLAEANDDRFNAAWNHAVLGFIDLSLADLEGARRNLEPAVAWLDRLHSAEPAIIPCVPDLVEALVGLGRIGEAERHLRRLEEQAEALDRLWARAAALRCRALIAAAAGDLDGAQRSAEASVGLLEAHVQPFETARSVMVLGQVHRRAKKKRAAREQLERARDLFAELGAVLWVGRANAELARIGGRPVTPFELTDTEAQIAALVAQGRTNQETADALFVSAATVQASLKRIYQKLGVRSRTELAARLPRPD
jgi:ATP/maltotriose-dependent transcriptional regulator MalT